MIRDLESNREVARYPVPAAVADLAFSPDGAHLAARLGATIFSMTVLVWQLDAPGPHPVVRTAAAGMISGRGFDFSPGSDRLVVSLADGDLGLYDLSSRRLSRRIDFAGRGPQKLPVPMQPLRSKPVKPAPPGVDPPRGGYPQALFDPTGRKLAVFRNAGIEIVDLDGAAQPQPPAPLNEAVRQLAWHPDAARAAMAGLDRRVHVLDTRRPRSRPLFSLQGHADEIRSLAFEPGGQLLATSGQDGLTILWSLAARTELLRIRGSAAAFSRNGHWLGLVDGRKHRVVKARLVRSETHDVVGHGGNFAAGNCFETSPDGRWLAIASVRSPTANVSLWDLRGRRLVDGQLRGALLLHRAEPLLLTAKDGVLRRQRVAIIDDAGGVHVDIGSPQDILLPARHSVRQVLDSGNGDVVRVQVFVAEANDPLRGKVLRADLHVATGELRPSTLSPTAEVSPCGAWIAKLRVRHSLAIHDAGTDALVFDVPGPFSHCVFRRDGKALAALLPDRCVLLESAPWRVVHHVPMESLLTRYDSRRVAFSADGRLLALPAATGSITLLELPSYRAVVRLALSDHDLQELAFSTDGRWLFVGAADGAAHIIHLAGVRGRLAGMGLDWAGPAPAP